VCSTSASGEHLFGARAYTALTAPPTHRLWPAARRGTLGWFILTAAKIGLAMAAILVGGALMVTFVMGATPGSGFAVVGGALVGLTLVASVLWGLATWGADRWIARARVEQDHPAA
jgi:hypothetical protein